MKAFFAVAVASALTVAASAQRHSSVPPPVVPDITPARPQPGIVTGATGGIAVPPVFEPPHGITGGVPTNRTGRSSLTPIPLLVVPNTDGPELFDSIATEGVVLPPPEVVEPQGSPGGLGVTITGGNTNPPAPTDTAAPAHSTGEPTDQ